MIKCCNDRCKNRINEGGGHFLMKGSGNGDPATTHWICLACWYQLVQGTTISKVPISADEFTILIGELVEQATMAQDPREGVSSILERYFK